jgi:hypothetical protein
LIRGPKELVDLTGDLPLVLEDDFVEILIGEVRQR